MPSSCLPSMNSKWPRDQGICSKYQKVRDKEYSRYCESKQAFNFQWLKTNKKIFSTYSFGRLILKAKFLNNVIYHLVNMLQLSC